MCVVLGEQQELDQLCLYWPIVERVEIEMPDLRWKRRELLLVLNLDERDDQSQK
jgi:hypothetical protein